MIPELEDVFRYPVASQRSILIETVRTLVRERDELRAEVDRLKAVDADNALLANRLSGCELERDAMGAEAERLKADKARLEKQIEDIGHKLLGAAMKGDIWH
jgi:hypothetical protein